MATVLFVLLCVLGWFLGGTLVYIFNYRFMRWTGESQQSLDEFERDTKGPIIGLFPLALLFTVVFVIVTLFQWLIKVGTGKK